MNDEIEKLLLELMGKDLSDIGTLLDDYPTNSLLSLFDEIINNNPYLYDGALLYIVRKEYSTSNEFQQRIVNLIDKVSSGMTMFNYDKIQEIVRLKPEITHTLILSLLEKGSIPGLASGILLSMIIEIYEKSANFFQDNLYSENNAIQKTVLITYRHIICRGLNVEIEPSEDIEMFSSILIENNTYLFIQILYCAYEIDEKFEDLLTNEIRQRGLLAARDIIKLSEFRDKIPLDTLKTAVELLESESINDPDIDIGLSVIYPHDKVWVIEIIRNRIDAGERVHFISDKLLWRIRQEDIKPLIELYEEYLRKELGLRLIGGSLIYRTYKHPTDAIEWCDKWKDDEDLKDVVIEVLKSILTPLINYESNNERDRSISIVKYFASKHEIHYENETKSISLSSDKKKGWEYKEMTLKALLVLELISFPPVKIDIDTISTNLSETPNIAAAFDINWLFKNATEKKPHVITQILNMEKPQQSAIDEIEKRLTVTDDLWKRLDLSMKYQSLIRPIQLQDYWESVFKKIADNGIMIPKNKLHDFNNANSYLSEIEVIARLSDNFNLIIDPKPKQLLGKKLDIQVEYNGEIALIEIASVHERQEVSLATGGISIKGGKVKHVLLSKYQNQLHNGLVDPEIPIIFLLKLEGFIDDYDVSNGVYGVLTSSITFLTEFGEAVHTSDSRKENGIYHHDSSGIISLIGSYKPTLSLDTSLIGRFYYPISKIKNIISPSFYVRLRDTLFGDNIKTSRESFKLIDEIDDDISKTLFDNGIDDISMLALSEEETLLSVPIDNKLLIHYQDEAKRILTAISTGSIVLLKNMNKKHVTILHNNDIYYISQFLKLKDRLKDIPQDAWDQYEDEALRLFGREEESDQ